MKRKWSTPNMSTIPFDLDKLGDISNLSDAELKMKLEEGGYSFNKRFQVKNNYIHRKIADSDVLISIGENIANFNGYIQLNTSAAFLWDEMKEPKTCMELEQALENQFNLPHEQAVEDALDFLKELQTNDMVVIL